MDTADDNTINMLVVYFLICVFGIIMSVPVVPKWHPVKLRSPLTEVNYRATN